MLVYGFMTGSAYWKLDLLMVQVYTIADGGENRQSLNMYNMVDKENRRMKKELSYNH